MLRPFCSPSSYFSRFGSGEYWLWCSWAFAFSVVFFYFFGDWFFSVRVLPVPDYRRNWLLLGSLDDCVIWDLADPEYWKHMAY